MSEIRPSLEEVEALARGSLMANGCDRANAEAVAGAIKEYRRRDETWFYLQGWLEPDESGRQDIYSDQIKLEQVARIATIVYVKVKL